MGGFLTSYNIKARNGVAMNISHLLLADDTLVFCKDTEEQMEFLSWILLCFEALFDLRVIVMFCYVLQRYLVMLI